MKQETSAISHRLANSINSFGPQAHRLPPTKFFDPAGLRIHSQGKQSQLPMKALHRYYNNPIPSFYSVRIYTYFGKHNKLMIPVNLSRDANEFSLYKYK